MMRDPRAGRGLNVLLVEDDPLIAFEVRMTLLDIGVEAVENAATVAEALSSLDDGTFDFGVLDYEIGTGTVMEVASRMRQLGIPFVISSGHDDLDLGHGFNGTDVLAKPYGIEQLERALHGAVC